MISSEFLLQNKQIKTRVINNSIQPQNTSSGLTEIWPQSLGLGEGQQQVLSETWNNSRETALWIFCLSSFHNHFTFLFSEVYVHCCP